MQTIHAIFPKENFEKNYQDSALTIDVGPQHFGWGIFNPLDKKLWEAKYYTGSTDECNSDQVHKLLQEMKPNFSLLSNIKIYSNFPQFMLVPDAFSHKGKMEELMNIQWGENSSSIRQYKSVKHFGLSIAFEVPGSIYETLQFHFPNAEWKEAHAAWISEPNMQLSMHDSMQIYFYPGHMTVILKLNGKLQLMQDFSFTKSDDITYHLANICRLWSIQPDNFDIQLYGIIEKYSWMYTGVDRIFKKVELKENIDTDSFPDQYSLSNAQAHFFSPLIHLSSCAS